MPTGRPETPGSTLRRAPAGFPGFAALDAIGDRAQEIAIEEALKSSTNLRTFAGHSDAKRAYSSRGQDAAGRATSGTAHDAPDRAARPPLRLHPGILRGERPRPRLPARQRQLLPGGPAPPPQPS